MKRFNVTGPCIANKHYKVIITEKMNKIYKMINLGQYFCINRPRQYGKTTTLATILFDLEDSDEYLPIWISFEGLGDSAFSDEKSLCRAFLTCLITDCAVKQSELSEYLKAQIGNISCFQTLSQVITDVVKMSMKKIVLMIDEVDSAGNHDVFIKFLAMLRDKYIAADMRGVATFHSVILCGLHDVKSLKLKIRSEKETNKFNSPWNIAVKFDVDLSFTPPEIATMLTDYVDETKIHMDITKISERLYFWTSGYPFLVSQLCQMVDEKVTSGALLVTGNREQGTGEHQGMGYSTLPCWVESDIDEAVITLLLDSNTLFSSMTKYLEEKKDLYALIESIVFGTHEPDYDSDSPLISLGLMYGFIAKNGGNKIKIHNKIFENKYTNYFLAGTSTNRFSISNNQTTYTNPDGSLNFEMILTKFQQVIKENYIEKQFDKYNEVDLRILFLMFLKPIINGHGFFFKEAQIGEEKRLDVVVVYKNEKFVVELKVWHGESYHNTGKAQLKKYMELESIKNGYMLIMSKNKEKEYKIINEDGMLMVWV